LKIFWARHDPTERKEAQYKSAIFYHNEEQRRLAEESKEEHFKILNKEIVTEILPASTFYNAEQ